MTLDNKDTQVNFPLNEPIKCKEQCSNRLVQVKQTETHTGVMTKGTEPSLAKQLTISYNKTN